jgi:hypothetical protein
MMKGLDIISCSARGQPSELRRGFAVFGGLTLRLATLLWKVSIISAGVGGLIITCIWMGHIQHTSLLT